MPVHGTMRGIANADIPRLFLPTTGGRWSNPNMTLEGKGTMVVLPLTLAIRITAEAASAHTNNAGVCTSPCNPFRPLTTLLTGFHLYF